jgi:hypothetical protein
MPSIIVMPCIILSGLESQCECDCDVAALHTPLELAGIKLQITTFNNRYHHSHYQQ